MNTYSPIILFTYKRLSILKKTISSLSKNMFSLDSDLIILSDGWKNEDDRILILQVREYLKNISGFKSVKIIESSYNKGLANSIIQGVSEVFKTYDKAIVLEDDLILSDNFLSYMNQALNFYKDNNQILSVCGYSPIIKGLCADESFFTTRSSSWGWATWANRWEKIDWTFSNYDSFIKNKKDIKTFKHMGSDMLKMLVNQKKGLINSWAIRFCFHQFQMGLFSVHPAISKVDNIGINDSFAENTRIKSNRFKTIIDKSLNYDFHFENTPYLNDDIIKQFKRPNSFINRFISKFKFI